MIRTKASPARRYRGSCRHMRTVQDEIRKLVNMSSGTNFSAEAKVWGRRWKLVIEVLKPQAPRRHFAAGDRKLRPMPHWMMQLGADGVLWVPAFLNPVSPVRYGKSNVKATTHYKRCQSLLKSPRISAMPCMG